MLSLFPGHNSSRLINSLRLCPTPVVWHSRLSPLVIEGHTHLLSHLNMSDYCGHYISSSYFCCDLVKINRYILIAKYEKSWLSNSDVHHTLVNNTSNWLSKWAVIKLPNDGTSKLIVIRARSWNSFDFLSTLVALGLEFETLTIAEK